MAQTDILNLATLKSLGFHPDTLIKLQVRVTSTARGSQMDIRGGIFPSVRSANHGNHRKTVRLFYVAENISQNLLSCPCLQALFVIDQDFPKDRHCNPHNPSTRQSCNQSSRTLHPGTLLRDAD